MNATERTVETPATRDKYFHEQENEAHARKATLKNYLILVLILFLGYAIYGLVRASGKTIYVPYPIEVREDGSVRKVGALEPMFQANDLMMRKDIRVFLMAIRSRFHDEKLTKYFWNRAGLHTRGAGRNKLAALFRDEQPLAYRGKVEVDITRVIPIPNADKRYEVRWTETKYKDGSATPDGPPSHWSGLFSLEFELPTGDGLPFEEVQKVLEENPTGIWIADWQFSSEEH